MVTHVQAPSGLRAGSGRCGRILGTSLGCLALLASLECMAGGSHASGDHAGQTNGPFLIIPPAATIIEGQSLQFSASSPWGGGASWSVVPASGGSIDAGGNFTALMAPGSYRIVALWNEDIRYTATATATVVEAPASAELNLGVVQAFGQHQAAPDGSLRNDNVVGEPVAVQNVTGATGSYQVRHGFFLPPAI